MTRSLLFVAAVGLILATGASASTSVPSFLGCHGTRASVRPHSILVACGDGGYYLARLHWSSWTPASAAAIGTAHVNDCTPNCAAGRFHLYRGVSVRLTRPESCSDGRRLFTRIEWTYTRRKPTGIHRHALESAPFWTTPRCP
jgi:hypothetical protein